MSNVMLFGVLKMPYEMAMESELSRLQFYQRVQQLVARVEAQPAQEPVGVLHIERLDKWLDASLKERKQREWVGLNEKERNDIEDDFYANISIHVFDAIEAKLKEKNNGT